MAAAAKAPATPVAIPTAPGMTTQSLLSRADLLFAGALFATVLLLIVPVPPILLDGLLAISIGISLLVLLTIVYVEDPPEFSAFPTILLAFTLFRLSLNICSTRLILTKGHAGDIIDSFGNFVIQGNYIVGFVIFLILVVVNFVVITKGAGRIAEVSARFTLDALPGNSNYVHQDLHRTFLEDPGRLSGNRSERLA